MLVSASEGFMVYSEQQLNIALATDNYTGLLAAKLTLRSVTGPV